MIKTGTNLYFAEVLKLPSGAGKQTLYKGKRKKQQRYISLPLKKLSISNLPFREQFLERIKTLYNP